MIIDVTIAAILIICIFIGDRKGFFLSFISTFGWIVSVIASRILQTPFIEYIDAHTNMREDITVKVAEYIKTRIMLSASDNTSINSSSLSDSVAAIIKNSANSAVNKAAEEAAGPIADAIFTILAFVLLMIVIRLAFWLIERIIGFFISESKTLSSLNSILGMIMAFIKGCILSFVLLALVFVVAVVGDIPVLLDQISSSLVCTTLINADVIPNVFANFN